MPAFVGWEERRKMKASRLSDAQKPTLLKLLNAHCAITPTDAQQKFEPWRRDHNEVRPHGAIGNQVPNSLQIHGGAANPSP